MNRLDICIAAFRLKGLREIASLGHPALPGVRYIVAWQYGPDSPEIIPPELAEREDFIIIPNATRGSGANRRVALDAAEAEIVLTSDDDVSYTPGQLSALIQAFDERPDCDFLTFRYHSDANPRPYPEHEFDLRKAPKNYFFGGPEIAFRLAPVRRAGVSFNPLFGVGAEFPAGEDEIIVFEMMKAGLRGRFVPLTIAGHESDSTGMRGRRDPAIIRAKGAVFGVIHPRTWALRMISHTLRLKGSPAEKFRYCRAWLRGYLDLKRITRTTARRVH